MIRRLSILSLIVTMAAITWGQSFTFTNPNVNYSVEFPSATWRNTAQPDELRGQAEWVYDNRNDGYLQIKKEAVEAGTSTSAFAHSDRDNRLHFLPGFVDGAEERFAGSLSGTVLSYEYTAAGKPMLGRIYYLQADPRTIYVLRFTGYKDKLSRIRNQTDGIARSFKLNQ